MSQSNIKFAPPSPEKVARRRRNTIAAAAIAVLVAGAATWAFWPQPHVPTLAKTPDEFRQLDKTERRAAVQELGGTMQERMDSLRGIEDSQERRNAMRNAMGEARQEQIDEYFAATPEQRVKLLDKQIDEMQKMREEMQKRRTEAEANGTTRPDRGARGERGGGRDGQTPGGAGRGAEGGDRGERGGADRGGRGGGGGGANNPAARAQRTEYRAAMANRAKERGIEMPGRGGR